MRKLYFIITILICCLILSCSGKNEVELTEIRVEETDRIPEPPPPSFSCSNTVTLQEWFFKLCDTEKPAKDTLAYKLGFFETGNCYAIYLVRLKDHEKEGHVSKTIKEDEQPVEYYPLSKSEYKDLKWEKVLDKIKTQLAEFTKTEKFKNSSLAKANAVTIGFDDGDLVRIK
jgi:hypothetical protein